MTAPCAPWLVKADLPCSADLDDTQAALAIDAATFVLWALGGRRHGICEATVRPCSARCVPGDRWHRWGTPYRPVLYEGEWLNLCHHTVDCGCSAVEAITLPLSPVVSVSQVRIGADVLVAGTDYRVDGRQVIRLGGERWPTTQDMAAAPGEAGAFDITFTYGVEVDALGVTAAAELACEIGKSIAGKPCRLPARVTSLTRQGVSMALLDPQQFLTEGRTGLYLADLWLATVNPDGLPRRSAVMSPDIRRPHIR